MEGGFNQKFTSFLDGGSQKLTFVDKGEGLRRGQNAQKCVCVLYGWPLMTTFSQKNIDMHD